MPFPASLYRLSSSDLRRNGGTGLLKRANYSIYRLVTHAFPEVDWKPWKFDRTPRRFWQDPANTANYLESIKTE